MSTLTFPTIAEQVEAEFRAATTTTSIATLAKKRGAEKRKLWDGIEYTFDDDTKLITRGRGAAHRIETELP